MKSRNPNDRIPSGELTAYERWELPLLDEKGNRKPTAEDHEEAVKPLTAADLEAIRQEAYEDGHREGLEDGRVTGRDEGAREGYRIGYDEGQTEGVKAGETRAYEETKEAVEARLARLDELASQLLSPIEDQQEAVEAAFVNLSMAVVRSVIHRELQMDSTQVRALVRTAMTQLPEPHEQLRIRVHPDDVEVIRTTAERYGADTRVVADEALMPGGCIVESDHSLVDYTVEKRFQKVVQQMLDAQLADDSGPESGELDAMMGELSDLHRDVLDEPSAETDASSEADGASDEGDDDDQDPR